MKTGCQSGGKGGVISYRLPAAFATVFGAVLATQAMAEDRRFLIANHAVESIEWIYVSNKYHTGIIELLGSKIVPPGQEQHFAFPAEDYCRYDFRFEFAGGRIEDIFDVDLCKTRRITIQ
jgi:hypothetical protein